MNFIRPVREKRLNVAFRVFRNGENHRTFFAGVVDDKASVYSSDDSKPDRRAKMDEIMDSSHRRAMKVEWQGIMWGEEQVGFNLSNGLSKREQFRQGVSGIIMIDYPGKIRWEIQKLFVTGTAEEDKFRINI